MPRKIALTGVLTGLAIVVSVLEQYIPIQAILPLPGLKVGIANVITLTALIKLTPKYAFSILLLRCCISAMLFGTPISFAMSICGGLLALFVMSLLYNKNKWFSLFGVSIAGAAAHNIGQIVCAVFWLRSIYVVAYLPFLLIGSFLTGTLIALLCKAVNRIRF